MVRVYKWVSSKLVLLVPFLLWHVMFPFFWDMSIHVRRTMGSLASQTYRDMRKCLSMCPYYMSGSEPQTTLTNSSGSSAKQTHSKSSTSTQLYNGSGWLEFTTINLITSIKQSIYRSLLVHFRNNFNLIYMQFPCSLSMLKLLSWTFVFLVFFCLYSCTSSQVLSPLSTCII